MTDSERTNIAALIWTLIILISMAAYVSNIAICSRMDVNIISIVTSIIPIGQYYWLLSGLSNHCVLVWEAILGFIGLITTCIIVLLTVSITLNRIGNRDDEEEINNHQE